MSTLDEVTEPAPEATKTSTPWRPAYALDLITRLAGVVFLVGGLILVYCADPLLTYDGGGTDRNIAELIDGLRAGMGLSIVVGFIAVIGGAKPWAHRSVIGVMCFVIIQFTPVTRTFAWDVHHDSSYEATIAMVLLLAAWVMFVVAVVALSATVVATRTWRRPATAPFAVWIVALAGLAYLLWQRAETYGQIGTSVAYIPTWWWVVAVIGFVATVLLLGVTGLHPVRSVRVTTPVVIATLLLAMLLFNQIWEHWDELFGLEMNLVGYPVTIAASLAAAVLYAISREPDTQAPKG